jgi:leucyl aminopeptidase (aminopeptidase T)
MKTSGTPGYPVDNGELAFAAGVALDRLGLSDGEAFLVLSNPELVEIATELAEAARARTQNVRVQEFPPTSRDGEEPPDAVAAAMLQASAIAIVARFSLSHTQARRAATRAGARIASMPDTTADIFTRTIAIDYGQLERVGGALANKLTHATVCRVTAPGGTDLELSLRGREAICDDGDLLAPGAWGNLPAGEAFNRATRKRSLRDDRLRPLARHLAASRRATLDRARAGTSGHCRGQPPSGCSRPSRLAAKTAGRSPS